MMEVKPSLAQGLQKSVGTLWKGDDFCDFTVVVDGTSFQCHRFILSACSDFFQALFRSQMRESQENQAELQGMTASTFNVIINSVYRGVDGLTKDNVLDVWSATEQLQMRYLTEECEKFAIDNVSAENCISIFCHSRLHEAVLVEARALYYICRHFEYARYMPDFFKLSFADFCRIIESEHLTAFSEDSTLDAILSWVDYTENESPDVSGSAEKYNESHNVNSGHYRSSHGNNEVSVGDTGDNATLSITAEGTHVSENIDTQSTLPGTEVWVTDSLEERLNDSENSAQAMPEHFQPVGLGDSLVRIQPVCLDDSLVRIQPVCLDDSLVRIQPVCLDDSVVMIQPDRLERKQHLFPLLSASRPYLISSSCLDTLIHHPAVLLCKRSLSLVTDVAMYKLCVGRRHHGWPEAAVHRMASNMTHTMVFLSNNKFVAYSLDTGSIYEFADLPEDFEHYEALTVFDNVLFLLYRHKSNYSSLAMYVKEKCWQNVNQSTHHSTKILAHGDCIYLVRLGINDNASLVFLQYEAGCKRDWIFLQNLERCDSVISFQDYILAFSTSENNSITYLAHNTKSGNIFVTPAPVSGSTHGMVSFTHLGNTFCIHRNGSLWKVSGTKTQHVKFELVSKLWEYNNCDLRGSVVYRKELFVFCHAEEHFTACQDSLEGLFRNVKVVPVNTTSTCVPMVLLYSWFKAELS